MKKNRPEITSVSQRTISVFIHNYTNISSRAMKLGRKPSLTFKILKTMYEMIVKAMIYISVRGGYRTVLYQILRV